MWDCDFVRFDSDVDSWRSGVSVVSVVSSRALASCDTERCPDELWENESVEQSMCFSVRNQCSPSSDHPFLNVLVHVEFETQPILGPSAGLLVNGR